MEAYPVGIPLEEARDCVLKHCTEVAREKISIDCADGRTLAEDITAEECIPPFARSPYDGYAIRSADTVQATKEQGVLLRIVEEVPAGHAPRKEVHAGEAVKILTGAPIPDGADAVVKFEDTDFTAQTVTVYCPYGAGESIVPAGEDLKKGDPVAAKGTVLDGALLGLLAGLGRTEVWVAKRPQVTLLSTGDELVDAHCALQPGKIRNSSVYTLMHYVRRCGACVQSAGIVPDRADQIAAGIAAAVDGADLVLTTGGVSVGDYDMLRKALELLGAEILFWKIRIKPGSAFVAALYRGKLILCLSGNPSAAVVAFFLLGIPVLRKMQGRRDVALSTCELYLGCALQKESPTRRFLPGRLEVRAGKAYLMQAELQGNGMLHPLSGCTHLGEIPTGSAAMEEGSMIRAYRLFE